MSPKGAASRPHVVFIGLHHLWPSILADGLSARFGDELTASSFVQGAGAGSVPPFVSRLATADLLVRVGVTLDPGSRLDRMFMATPRLRRRDCCALFWIGTDVLTHVRAHEAGTVSAMVGEALTAMPSMAGAVHLAEELAGAGVDATPVPFPAPVLSAPDEVPPMPDRFTVLTYLPAGEGDRFRFYGGRELLRAARSLPEVAFEVMGADSIPGEEIPGNMTLLGRVDDPASAYRQASVVVRLVEHDAVGGTVMEGLLFGRHVIYTMPLPHTTTVRFGDAPALIDALTGLKARHDAGELSPDLVGREWARAEFDPDARFAHLRDVLLELAQRSRARS